MRNIENILLHHFVSKYIVGSSNKYDFRALLMPLTFLKKLWCELNGAFLRKKSTPGSRKTVFTKVIILLQLVNLAAIKFELIGQPD